MPPKERLLPSLIDRLTDDSPAVKRPEGDRFVFDLPRYRGAVFRDLEWLLNATAPIPHADVEGLEEVRRSVLNYGMPPLSGGTATSLEPRVLEKKIREVVLRFEPRILAESLEVQVVLESGQMTHRALTFRVEGLLWAQPAPEQIYVRTEVDLETGHVTMADVGYAEHG